jgi:hypothetical protein
VQTSLGSIEAANVENGTLVEVLVAPAGINITPPGQGVAAAISENRSLGNMRRLVVRVEGQNAPFLVHSVLNQVGPCGLVLNGQHTHIFATTNE